ncbi:hypothetical protein FIBSPDRAFT_706815, partial [Athelia psychrophila]
MPVRRHSTAPRWDGEARDLQWFLEDVEAVSAENALSEAATIKAALRYAPPSDSDAWKYTAGSEASSWPAFVEDVLALYPGTLEKQRNTRRALEALVSAQATVRIKSRSDFGKYHRDFLGISGSLIKAGRLDTGRRDELFVNGIHPELRSLIITHHYYKFPDHDVDDAYPYKEILAAADRVFSGAHPGLPIAIGDTTPP